jgi:hypothetical protein
LEPGKIDPASKPAPIFKPLYRPARVQGSMFRVKDKEGIKDPKFSLNSLIVYWLNG